MNQKILIAIVAVVALGGLVLLALQYWILGGILTVIGGVLLFLYWRLNTILKISEAIAQENMPLAKERLAAIKNPERLNDYSKTYYNFFQGIVQIRENDFKESEASFKRALEINRFRAAEEKATTHLMLAQLLLRKRNREGGKRHLQEARTLTTNQQILEQIRQIAKQARIRL